MNTAAIRTKTEESITFTLRITHICGDLTSYTAYASRHSIGFHRLTQNKGDSEDVTDATTSTPQWKWPLQEQIQNNH